MKLHKTEVLPCRIASVVVLRSIRNRLSRLSVYQLSEGRASLLKSSTFAA